jgi:chromosome segregation ATPase
VGARNPATDPALLQRLSHLIDALEEERRRLAGRLDEIEGELNRLASAVASREDLREAPSPRP